MLLEDLGVAPAPGPVKLGDDRCRAAPRVLEPRLVHAVLVAVEREQAPVADETRARERIEHGVRGEARVRRIEGHEALYGSLPGRPGRGKEKVRPRADSLRPYSTVSAAGYSRRLLRARHPRRSLLA